MRKQRSYLVEKYEVIILVSILSISTQVIIFLQDQENSRKLMYCLEDIVYTKSVAVTKSSIKCMKVSFGATYPTITMEILLD
jgi:hypothetical protein